MPSLLDGLACGQVHVYVAPVGAELPWSLRELCLSVLAGSERSRYDRLAHDRDRRSFLVGRGLLRHALSRYADVAAARWTFADLGNGKPGVAGPGAATGLRFNATNTEGLAACALALERDVGIDAEALGRIRDAPAVAAAALGERELADLAARPVAERAERLLHYWTLKEAYLKATGAGLGGPLRRISFELGADGAIRLELAPEVGDRPERWHFARIPIPSRHVVALAVERTGAGAPPDVRLFDGLELLRAALPEDGPAGWRAPAP